MSFVFYDFETSSRSFLGQILSYSFIVTTPSFEILNECSGLVKLNRTQLPEVGAMLTNRLLVSDLMAQGESEYDTAKKIFEFLTHLVLTYQTVTLVGFNSNSFDLSYLRTLLTRYGFDPYFKGALKNLDLLHYSQYLAFQYPNDFLWVQTQSQTHRYYSFRLEDLCSSFGLLTEAQSHDAREDVLLSIRFSEFLSRRFQAPLTQFVPFEVPESFKPFDIGLSQARHFVSLEEDIPLEKYVTVPYLFLCKQKSASLWLNLLKAQDLLLQTGMLSDDDLLGCVFYRNQNKDFFIVTEAPSFESSTFDSLCLTLKHSSLIKQLVSNLNAYFALTDKSFDIDYMPHQLGFDRLPILFYAIEQLVNNPDSYLETLNELLEKRKSETQKSEKDKDFHLIRLYNRAYLNLHPSPDPLALKRYLLPRYETGELYVGKEKDFVSFTQSFKEIQTRLNDPDLTESDLPILRDLLTYYQSFSEYFLTAAPS